MFLIVWPQQQLSMPSSFSSFVFFTTHKFDHRSFRTSSSCTRIHMIILLWNEKTEWLRYNLVVFCMKWCRDGFIFTCNSAFLFVWCAHKRSRWLFSWFHLFLARIALASFSRDRRLHLLRVTMQAHWHVSRSTDTVSSWCCTRCACVHQRTCGRGASSLFIIINSLSLNVVQYENV